MTRATPRPEVWAGVECSYLTVGDWTCDQLVLTGNDDRLDDLERLAGLGITALRDPILWGRDRGTGEATDWAWAEARLAEMERLGIEPITGLLHHGFGPEPSDPLDPSWRRAFRSYAVEVTRRFPSISTFLPINEPLTTARFGGLYGWWPPYGADDEVFIGLLLAQARAFRDAARAIRSVRPDARILINEDIGRTFGTRPRQALIDHANERRWLTFDLVTGRFDPSHPLWRYVARTPHHRRILDDLRREPEPPDVLGIDYYVTSDRFLDHRVRHYPLATRGSVGGVPFADVEAARVADVEIEGFGRLLADAWNRYQLPVALTEVQLAGEPDDQVAWWSEAWTDAQSASRAGIPVAGVTAWAALGSYEWASVLRSPCGLYESGCFDVSQGVPDPTPLADAVRATARGRRLIAQSGWWRREDRVRYRPTNRRAAA